MAVYEDGYECPECGPVRAKIGWNKEENDTVAYCEKCGMILQRVIPKPFSSAAFKLLGTSRHDPIRRETNDP